MDYRPLLRELGASVKYKGYVYLLTALEMLQKDPELIHQVTKGLYHDIGKRCRTNGWAVERCLRTLIKHMWKTNQPLMVAVLSFPAKRHPSTSTFLAALIALPEQKPAGREAALP